ncbi:CHAT domain-containing protein [Micromonospora sp. NPDC018662]|uniref:CHAT domain-containing protein n=1 Tax=Micromonospora sp. NPDC018662 TaxID=3364238 RepID=UPI00378E9E6D
MTIDHDAFVTELVEAYRHWPADDPGRDDLAIDLAEAIWDRYWARLTDPARPLAGVADDVDEMVAALRDIDVASASPEPAAHVRAMLGMALLARYDQGGRRLEDLDQGIAVLADALGRLPVETDPYFADAALDLAAAHLELAGLREDRTSVERAVSVAGRALDACVPGTPDWLPLHRVLGTAHQVLWALDEDPADLTAAISAWRTVQESGPDPAVHLDLAELLRDEATRTGQPHGLAEAVDLLTGALPFVADPAPVWHQLGKTHLLRWQLAGASEDLERAVRWADDAVAASGQAEDDLLAAHMLRIVVANEVHTDGVVRGRDAGAGLERLRAALDDADHALRDPGSADPVRRAELAAVMICGEFGHFGTVGGGVDMAKLRRLFALARSPGDAVPPLVVGLLDMAEGLLAQYSAAIAAEQGSDAGMDALLRAERNEALMRAEGPRLRTVLSYVLNARASRLGDLRGYGAALDLATSSAAAVDDRGSAHVGSIDARVMSLLMAAAGRGYRGDLDGMRKAVEQATTLRHGHHGDLALAPLVRALREAVALISGTGQVTPRAPVRLPAGPLSQHAVMSTVMVAATQVYAAERRGDRSLLRRWADHLADLAGRLPPGHAARVGCLKLAAQAELAHPGRAAAARAAEHLRAATAEVGPEDLLWIDLTRDHARALRLAGHPDRAHTRRLGLAALHGHARRVLLQAGTDQAMDAVRAVAADATTVVRWCLQDQADDDLVAALDAGRGLVLHAATGSRTVADLLDEAGCPELAQEWRDTAGLGRDQGTGDPLDAVARAGEIPDDLRPRVLRVLEDRGYDPWTPVRLDDVRAALAELDLDALVYLVPAAHPAPGFAVVVPARGRIDLIELPHLVAGDGSPVRALLGVGLGVGRAARRRDTGSGRERDAGPAGEAGSTMAGTPLDDLCRWAWRAAMGRVVDATRTMRADGPARVVVVPMGVLGLVPWHAAYRETPSGRRYAVQDLVISYSPSARMLCGSAIRPQAPIRSALVVGDPLGDLPFAGAEARAIHRRFHPLGRYLGGPSADPDRVARPDEVLAWLRTAPGPILLHLACHGQVDPARPADSWLALAGGRLPARQLLETSRLAGLELGQVFLAACTTNLVGGLHDEAFSLATAFLAAGAQTVFGSLWSVPDVGTSLLMYLVHHHLYEDGCRPAEALHRAQLWMLDPGREPPPGMPAALASQCGRDDNARPLAWAAFTHLGR